ncbi:MAG TPA: SxtJ family membrane protein [Pyrinomonadaceae bacterium]|nr:SxtJ family membrane protein [Pyrinomonadaceae bacterium]
MIEPRGITVNHDARVSEAQARKTAAVVAAVLLLIAAWNLYRGRTTVVVIFGSLGALLVVVGLFIPAAARRFHVAWMRLAVALGYVNSRVLLSLMFYGAITPYGFVSRLVGRDPLRRRGKKLESYWIERKTTKQAREQFERLF